MGAGEADKPNAEGEALARTSVSEVVVDTGGGGFERTGTGTLLATGAN